MKTAEGESRIRLGWYFHPNHIPLCVVDKGTPAGEQLYGPWVTYHMKGEEPDRAAKVLWTVFQALLDVGYVHEADRERLV